MRTALVLLFIISCFSCNGPNAVPAEIIPHEKMETILWQLMQSDEYLNSFAARDSVKKNSAARIKIYQQVFALNKTSKAEFEKSYHYYLDHPDRIKIMFDSISVRAVRQRGDAYNKPKTKTAK